MSATVIVPVYNAAGELGECLQALRRTLPGDAHVLMVDDASTDRAVKAIFRDVAKRGDRRWQLQRNFRNLGYVRTVNRAMAGTHEDVILLNSDTVPVGRWYERMLACADSDPAIATATPFSNNAEICSFPEFCVNNPPPENPETVARAMLEAGAPSYPDIATAVGFCMYIRRAALNQLGLFDTRFGLGYGEENDFCMRVRAAGWRNVLCDDAYVVHLGGRSFGPRKLAPKNESAMARLRARHPDYEEIVAEFIRRDPIAPRREAIQRHLDAIAGSGGIRA